MSQSNPRGIKLYEKELEVLMSLDEKMRGNILSAVVCQFMGGEIPKLDPAENAIFVLIYEQVKRAEELSEKRRNNVNSRYKGKENIIEDTNTLQNCTNELQKGYKEDTDLYTNTITITNTKNISSETDDKADGQLSLTEESHTGTADKPEKKNTVTMSVQEAAEIIYKAYPRKEGKAKGFEQVRQLLKGKHVSGIGRVKFNHEQLYCAVKEYALCCEENGAELKFIQLFGTFMGRTVLDYVEKSAPGYENYMQREYGDEWRKIKFEYG